MQTDTGEKSGRLLDMLEKLCEDSKALAKPMDIMAYLLTFVVLGYNYEKAVALLEAKLEEKRNLTN